eukprot:comp23535_c1_seq1/m.39640 comp23535_c1_seq1/g.39640  ORF comp23535_c1_seq1/g.39640 comp23535_c1_seq1/m.39640 type:complete len:506 (-) comp23535_c1_seq1:681-2198(-)
MTQPQQHVVPIEPGQNPNMLAPGTISAMVYRRGGEVVTKAHQDQGKTEAEGVAAIPIGSVNGSRKSSMSSSSNGKPSGGKKKVTTKDVELDLRVCLMDGTRKMLAFDNGKKTTAQDVYHRMANVLALQPESRPFFALWITEQALDLLIKPHYEPFKLRVQWPEIMLKYTRRPFDHASNPRFEYRRHAFVTKYVERSIKDPVAIKLLYDECRFNIMSSLYPISVVDAAQLAGLDMQLIFGDYDPAKHGEGFLSEDGLKELIPKHLIQSEKLPVWINLISRVHQYHKGKNDPTLLHRLYLQYCRQFPFYGASFFYGKLSTDNRRMVMQDTPLELVRIGINIDGVHIVHHQTNTLRHTLPLDEIAWHASEVDRMLYIEYGSEACPQTITIITPQAFLIETMMLRFLGMKNEQDRIVESMQQGQVPVTQATRLVAPPVFSPSGTRHTLDLSQVPVSPEYPAQAANSLGSTNVPINATTSTGISSDFLIPTSERDAPPPRPPKKMSLQQQ